MHFTYAGYRNFMFSFPFDFKMTSHKNIVDDMGLRIQKRFPVPILRKIKTI